jgi:hypothetical protein
VVVYEGLASSAVVNLGQDWENLANLFRRSPLAAIFAALSILWIAAVQIMDGYHFIEFASRFPSQVFTAIGAVIFGLSVFVMLGRWEEEHRTNGGASQSRHIITPIPRAYWIAAATVAAGIIAIVGWASISTRTTIATDAPTPRVQFVKNQRLQLEPFKSSGPNEWWDAISYHAEYVSSGKHLMAYLEYQTADMAVFIRPTRMQLRDSQNFLRNGDLTLSVIIREERPDGQFNFIWGADLTKEKAVFLGNYRARIVLVDDNGNEQRYYFLITGGTIMNTDVLGGKFIPYPNFITAENLDFPTQWEAYDAQH